MDPRCRCLLDDLIIVFLWTSPGPTATPRPNPAGGRGAICVPRVGCCAGHLPPQLPNTLVGCAAIIVYHAPPIMLLMMHL